jgi:hypothetical protein
VKCRMVAASADEALGATRPTEDNYRKGILAGQAASGSPIRSIRPRTPAQAAELTDRRWTALEVLAYPAPLLRVG